MVQNWCVSWRQNVVEPTLKFCLSSRLENEVVENNSFEYLLNLSGGFSAQKNFNLLQS